MVKAAPRAIVQCRISFSGPTAGAHDGELYYAEDPVVLKYPEYFGPPKVRGELALVTAEPVEQATAAPGEKRGA